jgi:hypothetical protein
MKRSTGYVCLGLALLAATPAFAKRPAKEPPHEEVVQPTRHYDFDDDVVEGGLQNPDGEVVATRLPSKHPSLIKLRDDFLPELVKSAESN